MGRGGRAEHGIDAARGLFGDVFVEGAQGMAAGQDALDGGDFERAEACGVGERSVDGCGVVASAEQEDLSGVVRPDPRGQRGELRQERCGLGADADVPRHRDDRDGGHFVTSA
jgi:hypothetical protein